MDREINLKGMKGGNSWLGVFLGVEGGEVLVVKVRVEKV